MSKAPEYVAGSGKSSEVGPFVPQTPPMPPPKQVRSLSPVVSLMGVESDKDETDSESDSEQ